jgi:hypothetical protein
MIPKSACNDTIESRELPLCPMGVARRREWVKKSVQIRALGPAG